MSATLKFGNGEWATKKGSTLAYNDENGNFKPLPFTFDRAGSATRVNKEGLIEVVSNNEPRIDFLNDSNGALLLEPSRSNLVTYSEDFSQSVWSTWQSTKTLSNNINPKGTNGYYEISHTGSSTDNPNTRLRDVSLNGSYTLSSFIKINQSRYISLAIEDYDGDRARVYFDTINKTFTTVGNVGSPITNTSYSEFPNGWIRISLSVNLLNAVYNEVAIGIYNPSGSLPPASGEFISVFGAQLEQGSYATSYIPTQGSIGTRVAESCEQTVPDGIIGQTEGTMYAEFKTQQATNSNWFQVVDASYNNWVFIGITANKLVAYIKCNGIVIINSQDFVLQNNVDYKLALGYKSGSSAFYINGSEVFNISNTFTISNSFSEIIIGDNTPSEAVQYKQAKLYNTRLSNAELQALTSN